MSFTVSDVDWATSRWLGGPETDNLFTAVDIQRLEKWPQLIIAIVALHNLRTKPTIKLINWHSAYDKCIADILALLLIQSENFQSEGYMHSIIVPALKLCADPSLKLKITVLFDECIKQYLQAI